MNKCQVCIKYKFIINKPDVFRPLSNKYCRDCFLHEQYYSKFQYIGKGSTTFGVEIECLGLTRPATKWKITEDGTIDGDDGYEYKSPIYNGGSSSFRNLKSMCDRLKNVNAKINESCGLHVHLGVKPTELLFEKYMYVQDWIMSTIPEDRRDNDYCSQVDGDYVDWTYMKGDHSHAFEPSYKGTVEVRCHEGTTEYEDIYHWIEFWRSFLKSEKTSDGFDIIQGKPETIKHFKQRIARFK